MSNFSINIDNYLRIITKKLEQENNEIAVQILVNSKFKLHEDYSYDNWNGGIHGHALLLTIPEDIYITILDNRIDYEDLLKNEINQLGRTESEFIEIVTFEVSSDKHDIDWREKNKRFAINREIKVTNENIKSLWDVGGLKVFLSHKVDYKKETSNLKNKLKPFGISCFVAHGDIEPSQKWQESIENALFSMDTLVPLLTNNFHDSNWTDQEVGVAIGRQIPIIPVRLGRDPYGFIGKYQAIIKTDNVEIELLRLFFNHPEIKPKMVESFSQALSLSLNFYVSEELFNAFPLINELTEDQTAKIVEAINKNTQVINSYTYNGGMPNRYGLGVIQYLNKFSKNQYVLKDGKIVKKAF